MKTFWTSPILILVAMIFTAIGCKKVGDAKDTDQQKPDTDPPSFISGTNGGQYPSNETMLQYVVSGSGGRCGNGDYGSQEYVDLPTYTTPTIENGILSFASLDDMEKYQDALDILLKYWNYSNVDYEGTPQEIDHLGDEPLNAVDAALGFSSIRSVYELNEFNLNEGWENNDPLYVDDDDLQNVMNRYQEVKAGDNYIKHIGNGVYAEIGNNNYNRLLEARELGYSSIFLPDVRCYDETSGQEVVPSEAAGTESTCSWVTHTLIVNPVTAVPNSGNGSWEVEIIFTPAFYRQLSAFSGPNPLSGNFTIDWQDGTPLQTVTGYTTIFGSPYKTKHTYYDNYAPGVEITKRVKINFTVTGANSSVLYSCPNIVGETYEMNGSIKLRNNFDCFNENVKRSFNSTEKQLGGKYYRMKMKLKQRVYPYGASNRSKFEAILVLQKKSNNKWKKTKPPFKMRLQLKGDVYTLFSSPSCTNLVKSLNETETSGSAKKLKIKYKPSYYHHGHCSTPRSNPIYLNADYSFTNSGNQNVDLINKNLFQ